METEKKQSVLGGIAGGAAGAIVNTGLGMLTAGWADRRQLKQQGKLMDMQQAKNKEIADYNNKLQMKMWEDTNYSAQMEQLKKAGLNPALMYGQAGGGGTTGAAQVAPVSGGNATNHGMMNIESMMMGAQIELMKAQANKANADADKTRGVDTEETGANIDLIKATKENKDASTALIKMETEGQSLENKLRNETIDDQVKQIKWFAEKEYNTAMIAFNEKVISDATQQLNIQNANVLATQMLLNLQQTKANINLTNEQTKAIAIELNQEWTKLGLIGSGQAVDMENVRKITETMLTSAKWQAGATVVNGLLNLAQGLSYPGGNTINQTRENFNAEGKTTGGSKTTTRSFRHR